MTAARADGRQSRPRALVLAASLALSWTWSCGTQVVSLDPPTQAPANVFKPACISKLEGSGVACVYCGPAYSEQRGCLKCDVPTQTTAPSCSACVWSDQPELGPCKTCVDPSGAVTPMGCDELRKDLTEPAPGV